MTGKETAMEPQDTTQIAQRSAGTNVPPRQTVCTVPSDKVPVELLRQYSSSRPIAIHQVIRQPK
jgi:hypothetical protein